MSISEAENLLIQGDPCNAIAAADRALQLDPTNSYARQFRAWARQSVAGSDPLVFSDYRTCLRERPNDSSIFVDRAIARIRQSEFDMAVVDLTQAIQIDRAPTYFWLRSFAYRCQGRLDEAIQDLDVVVSLEPDLINVRISRAELNRRLERRNRALQDVDWVLERDPTNKDVKE